MAGRPKNSSQRIIDSSDRRLKWFDVNRYLLNTGVENLAWYYQILVRRELFHHLHAFKCEVRGSDKAAIPEWLSRKLACVLSDPIVTLESIPAHGFSVHNFNSFACFAVGYNAADGLSLLDFGDLLRWFEDILLDLYQKHIGYAPPFYRPGVKDSMLLRAFRLRMQLLDEYRREFALNTQKFATTYGAALLVDLDTRSEQLRRDFLKIISDLRDAYTPETEPTAFEGIHWRPKRLRKVTNRPWDATPKGISTGRLIPFLDLVIFEEQHYLEISPRAKWELLFPRKQP